MITELHEHSKNLTDQRGLQHYFMDFCGFFSSAIYNNFYINSN